MAQRVWRIAQHETGEAHAWDRCRDGLVECARWAAEHGVTLALQNHPPVIADYRDMLRMIAEVGSPALKACFDAPLAHTQGVTAMRKAAAEVGPLQVLSHFGGEYERDAEGRVHGLVWHSDGSRTPENFYAEFLRGMVDIAYDGYLGYELCHPLPTVDGVTVGVEFADLNARLAAEYMHGLLAGASTLGQGDRRDITDCRGSVIRTETVRTFPSSSRRRLFSSRSQGDQEIRETLSNVNNSFNGIGNLLNSL